MCYPSQGIIIIINIINNNIIYGFKGNIDGAIALQKGENYILNNTLVDNKNGIHQLTSNNEPLLINNIVYNFSIFFLI